MIKTSTFTLINAGFIPGISDEVLYIISYGEPSCVLYVGQCLGTRGWRLVCRLGRHFGADIAGCMKQNSRSGASRQFSRMFSRLPRSIQEQFTITLLNLHDLSNIVDLTLPANRLKMIGSGVRDADIVANKINKQTVDFCEKALASTLKPFYCKAGYCEETSILPDELLILMK